MGDILEDFMHVLMNDARGQEITNSIKEREAELKRRSKSDIPIHKCFCGARPKLIVDVECCGMGDYEKVVFVQCKCGLTGKKITIDGQGYCYDLEKTGHKNTADDAVKFWNNLFKNIGGTYNEKNSIKKVR